MYSFILNLGGKSEFSFFFIAFTTGYMFYDFYVSLRAYGLTLSGIFPSLGKFTHL